MPDSGGGTREQIMRGALRCVERTGLSGFSLEEVARESDLSRTSIYRYFPQGRQQLITETATWEMARFWTGVAEAVADLDSLEDRLVVGLRVGTERIRSSRIMANLMDPDLDELANALGPTEPLVNTVIRDYMTSLLEREASAGNLREGVRVEQASDYLTRMVLSVMSSPAGVDLTDESQTRALVRREFISGIVACSTDF